MGFARVVTDRATFGYLASVHGLVLIAPAISFGTWALVVPDTPTRRWGWRAAAPGTPSSDRIKPPMISLAN